MVERWSKDPRRQRTSTLSSFEHLEEDGLVSWIRIVFACYPFNSRPLLGSICDHSSKEAEDA